MDHDADRTRTATRAVAIVLAALAGPAAAEVAILEAPGVQTLPDPGAPSADRPAQNITPDNAATNDQAVASQVADALSADPALQGTRIEVLADQGKVILGGGALDDAQIARALRLAGEIVGDDSVVFIQDLGPVAPGAHQVSG